MAGHRAGFRSVSMFKEVNVPGTSSSLRWKTITICTGASASTLQDIKVAESCGGYAYVDSDTTNSNTRNRFIYWRTYQDVLELVEESLDMNLTGNMVRYRFQDTPVLPDITVHEAYGFVIILVATVASAHRLIFPHPSRLQQQLFSHQSLLLSELSGPSIFYEASLPDDPKNQHLLSPGGSITPHLLRSTSALCRSGETLFSLATNTGGILIVKMPPIGVVGVVDQLELSSASLMNKLWTGLIPGSIRGGGQPAGHTVLSLELVALQGEYYIFTVCRDLQLRVWDAKNKHCILTQNLGQYTSAPLDNDGSTTSNASGHVIKSVQGRNSQDLCVFLSLPKRAQFVFLTPKLMDSGYIQLQHNTTVERYPSDDLVDFAVTEDCLMTLWASQDGEPLVYTMDLSRDAARTGFEWVPVHLRQMSEVIVPSHRDPRDVYLEKIFEPGVFTAQDIIKALSVYRSAVGTMEYEALTNWETLKNEVTEAIHTEIQNQALDGELQEEVYTQLQNEQWEKFYSNCCQYKQLGEKAKGLFADPSTGLFAIIKKSAVSFLRPCDLTEELYLSSTITIPPTTLERLGLAQEGSPATIQQDLRLLCDCVQHISSSLPANFAHHFLSSLQSHQSPDQLLSQLRDILTSEPHVLTSIANTVSRMTSPVPAIEAVFALLQVHDYGSELSESMEDAGITDSYMTGLFAGPLGVTVLSQSFQQLVELRMDFVRDLSLLLVVIVNMEQEAGLTQSIKDTLTEELIPKGHDLLRCYKVLVWAAQALTTTNPNATLDYNLRQLSSLEITDNTTSRALARPISSCSPLMEVFIEGIGGDMTRQRLASTQLPHREGSASVWRSDVAQLLHTLFLLLWPASDETTLPEFLARACQYLRLQEYVQLTSSWCTWNEASLAFFLGLAHLHFGEPYKALKLFADASDGVGTESFLTNRLLQTEETDHSKLQILYYLKIIKQFEEHGLSDLVITMATAAINSANTDDPNLPSLQSKVFKQHLELGHNAEAFTAMMNNPDQDRRKDCLRQYLVVLCERGNLQDLVNHDYQDLEEEVVYILENRARCVDLFTHDYYSLLYCFFAFRDDYRKAGRVMYERGLRLSQEVPGIPSLQQQARCYLATLNSLRLVSPKTAWIVKPVFPSSGHKHGARSGKRSMDGQEKSSSAGPRMEILQLEDLEKEYLLLNARLRLLQNQPDSPLASGPMPSPEELLSLLCSAGLYDMGVALTKAFHLPPDTVLASLSLRCVTLALNTNTQAKMTDPVTSDWQWLKENNVPPCGARERKPSDQAWSLLQSYLSSLEDCSTSCHKCVAYSVLSQSFPLPMWLVNSFKTVDIASLLRVYLTFDLLSQAASLVVEYLDAVMDVLRGVDSPAFNLKGLSQAAPLSVWVPYTGIDQLLAALREQDLPAYSSMYQGLKTKLQTYQSKAFELSQKITAH